VRGLRILSWNIRTFGTHVPNAEDLRRIATIIIASQADIVCIQELMVGPGVAGRVGAPISGRSLGVIQGLVLALQQLDPGAGWMGLCSGVDSGFADHMRDAHAFLWQATPAKAALPRAGAPDAIVMLTGPVILRQPGVDSFPGRRPALLVVNVLAGTTATLVNVISYHAPTPCDRFSKGVGSGYGINALPTLPEIGGGRWRVVSREWVYEPSVTPLPQVDTLVLGDFNYSMDDGWAESMYKNLLTNYEACVSDPEDVQLTTYAPDATQAMRRISAYDNIFVLRGHSEFAPSLTFWARGVIDFIAQDARQLGAATGIRNYGADAAWYVVHLDEYKHQHGMRGLSDHLPVWAEFTIGAADATAQQILPTSGADNNCLLHAMFGTPVAGLYLDQNAGAHRAEMLKRLQAYRSSGRIPSLLERNAILASMIEESADDRNAVRMLGVLLGNNLNPFGKAAFDAMFGRYIEGIKEGRMLYVSEAQLLACIFNVTLIVHRVDRGQYVTLGPFNPGQRVVEVFHQLLHFCRWKP
jgi:hypothetical protein